MFRGGAQALSHWLPEPHGKRVVMVAQACANGAGHGEVVGCAYATKPARTDWDLSHHTLARACDDADTVDREPRMCGASSNGHECTPFQGSRCQTTSRWCTILAMAKLSKSASGSRHLRWAREILATCRAHLKHNYLLTKPQKAALEAEVKKLEKLVNALVGPVEAYRNFIDHAYVDLRANQRVGDFLCDEGERDAHGALGRWKKDIDAATPAGFASIFSKNSLSRVLRAGREKTVEFAETAAHRIRALPSSISGTSDLADALEKAAGVLKGFNREQTDVVDPQRSPLKSDVQKAVFDLREGLEQIDGRLRSHFSQDFIDSLYPELSRKGTVVADEEDEEDDTSAAPDAGTAGGE